MTSAVGWSRPTRATMEPFSRLPVEVEPTLTPDEITFLAKPWVTLVWHDPVNLMSYVPYVFRHTSPTKDQRPRS